MKSTLVILLFALILLNLDAYAKDIEDLFSIEKVEIQTANDTFPELKSVTAIAALNIIEVGKTDVSCFGGNDGTIDLDTTNTSGSASVLWSPSGATTLDVADLAAGIHTVTITDNNGPVSLQIEILEPAVLNATVSATNLSCNAANDGTITVSEPSGGSGSYEYRINTETWQNNGNFTDLPADTYSVEIRDAINTNCTMILSSDTITEPAVPNTPTITVENNCGESLLIASDFEGTLSWDTGETNDSIIVTETQNYTLTQLVDGCTSNPASALAEPKAIPTLAVTTTDPLVCQGLGKLHFTFSNVPDGTYTIFYEGGSFDDLTVVNDTTSVHALAGDYNNLTITVLECTSADGVNASLSDPASPSAPFVSIENSCGESLLSAYNYTGQLAWNTGDTSKNITVTIPGDYTVTQTIDGCTSDFTSVTAAPKPIPTIEVTTSDPLVCQGMGKLNFNFTDVPDATYTIFYNGNSFSSVSVLNDTASVQTAAGAYNDIKIIVNSCTSPDGINATLSDPNPPAAPTITVQNDCGESMLVATEFSGTLLWDTGETNDTIFVSETRDYTLTQTIDGCTSDIATASAEPIPEPGISLTENNPEACQQNGSIDFIFSNVSDGNYTIFHDGGSFVNVAVVNDTASVLAGAGTYNNLTITANECVSALGVNATLSDPNPPIPPTVSIENNCGESVLTATNYSGTLMWNTNETSESITVATAGDYTVTQTIDGCISDLATATASPKTIPGISVSENNPEACQEEGTLDFIFSGVPDGIYSIGYNGGSFSNVTIKNDTASVKASAGVYNELTIIVNGCTSPGGINASLSDPNPPPAPTITVLDNCGESLLIASNFVGTLTWDTNETNDSITAFEMRDYSVTQTVDGCTSIPATAAAVPKPIPTISISENNPEACLQDGSILFSFTDVNDGNYTINYDGGSFLNVAVANDTASVLTGAGTYSNLTISADECVSASGVHATLSDPNPPPAPTLSIENNCGESVLTATNYSGTLTWNTNETSESITVMTAGEYTLTQTIDGCVSDLAVATAAPKIIPNISVVENNPVVCQEMGSLDFNLTGVPDDTYTIFYNGNNFSEVAVAENFASVEAAAGVYNELTIIVNGCTSPAGVNAILSDPNPPPAPTITVLDNCGESVLIATDYSGTLKWDTGDTNDSLFVTEARDYSLSQTLNGCVSEPAIVSAAPKLIPTLTVEEKDPQSCDDEGTLDFIFTNVADGNYTILYDEGSFTDVAVINNSASVLAGEGNYNNLMIVIDNCSSEMGINASLSDPIPPNAPIVDVENKCGVSVLTASVYTGDLIWNTGESSKEITVEVSGNYSVFQEVNGCASEKTITRAVPQSIPSLSVSKKDPETCQGDGQIDFDFINVPNGSYTILYDGGSFKNVAVLNNAASVNSGRGFYNNLQIEVNGCTSETGIKATLSDPNAPSSPIIIVENSCGESVLRASDFEGTLKWSTGETSSSITVTEAQSYSLTQTINGCTSDPAVEKSEPLLIPDAPVFSIENNCDVTSTLRATEYENNATLEWSTGESNEIITVNTSGNYSLKQIVNGCTSEISSKTASPKNEPTLAVNEIIPESCQEQGFLEFSFTNVPDGTYTIYYENDSFKNVVITDNEAIIPADPGIYNNLSITHNECTSEVGVNAKITSAEMPETPTISVENDCGESRLSAGDFDENATLKWSTGETAATITVYKPGTYTLTQTLNECKSETAEAIVTPKNLPPIPEIEIENNCIETNVTIKNLEPDAWLVWHFDNFTDSTQNNNLTLSGAGDYTFNQQAGTCKSADTIISIYQAATPAPPTSKGDIEVCESNPIQQLTAEANPPDDDHIVVWYNEAVDGIEIAQPTLNGVGSITYYAESVNKNSECTSATRTPVSLTIKSWPASGFSDSLAIIGKPKSFVSVLIFPVNSMKYQWYLNDTEITNATNQFYYISSSDRKAENVFSVEVEVDNGCKAIFDYTYTGNLSSGEISGIAQSIFPDRNNTLSIFPNPGNDKLYISFDSEKEFNQQKLTAKIFSVQGACVLQKQLSQIPEEIDIGNLNPGVYSVVIYDAEQRLDAKKLIVTKH